MNRRQTIVVGVICLVAAFVSFLQGSAYSGLWFYLLAVLYPVLITGSYLIYLFRDQVNVASNERGPHRELAYLSAIATPIVLLLLSLVVLAQLSR